MGLHAAGALLSFLLLVAASSLGAVAAIPARLTSGVVIPAIAGSMAVALFSRHALAGTVATSPDVEDEARPTLARPDVLGMTLVAALAAVGAVVFLGGYGILVLPFFYGPPVAMQLVATRDLALSEALQTARTLMAGRWHLMLYLFATALLLGTVAIVPVGGLVSLAGGSEGLTTIAALSLGRALLIGSFAGFLGAMQLAIFRTVSEPAVTGEAASPG
jgi:hypothetical protein